MGEKKGPGGDCVEYSPHETSLCGGQRQCSGQTAVWCGGQRQCVSGDL